MSDDNIKQDQLITMILLYNTIRLPKVNACIKGNTTTTYKHTKTVIHDDEAHSICKNGFN